MRRLVDLLVDAAATWRLTELVVEDEIARPLREELIRQVGPKAEYLVGCKRCVSVWAGLGVASGLIPRPVRYALAASAAAIWVNQRLDIVQADAFDRRVRGSAPATLR